MKNEPKSVFTSAQLRNTDNISHSLSMFAFSNFRQDSLCLSNTVFYTERDYKYFLTTEGVVKCKQCVEQETGSEIETFCPTLLKLVFNFI